MVAVCIYTKRTLAEGIAAELLREANCRLVLWALDEPNPALARWTVGQGRAPKFTLLNRMREHYEAADLTLFVDDDVELPAGFLTRYTAIIEAAAVDLAQPALTPDSHFTYPITVAVDEPRLVARVTDFVEIGPVFSMSRRFLRVVTPFAEEPYMGFGLDWYWSSVLAATGMDAAIVDRTPVRHAFRAVGAEYEFEKALRSMNEWMASRGLREHEPQVLADVLADEDE